MEGGKGEGGILEASIYMKGVRGHTCTLCTDIELRGGRGEGGILLPNNTFTL